MALKHHLHRVYGWFKPKSSQQDRELERAPDGAEEASSAVAPTVPTTRLKEGSALVLFVHGLAGSPGSTWSSMLRVLESDHALNEFGYDCYSFPTGLWRPPLGARMPSIQELAEGLRTHIEIHHAGASKIYIVAHSLGGVIARQLILDCKKGGLPVKLCGAMLIASPHGGASLAALGNYLSAGHKHLAQLSDQSDIIDLISRDWTRLRIEDSLQVVYVVGGIDAVVPPASAAPYAGQPNVQTLIGYGHKDILDPADALDIRYKIVRNFLLGSTTSRATSPIGTPPASQPADPLFDQYSTEVEMYYVSRAHDRALTLVGKGRAAWLTGLPGSGKTVSLQRRALLSDCKVHSISLDTLRGLSPHALLSEVCSSLSERAGQGKRFAHDTPIHTLVVEFRKTLSTLGEAVTVIIEEVPLQEGPPLSLLASTLAKFIQMNRDNNGYQASWLISSLGDPRRGLGMETGKVLETVEVIPVDGWSAGEIRSLIDFVIPALNVEISEAELENLIDVANGSPRFLKVALRQKRGQPHRSLNELVEALRLEWRQL